ncbi:MAG: DegT/DnrJ/EryC1/StrS family aminotransferase [Armatimonadota bacterium]|nr:DegT/DnrJ/EryC1/StrS family aminotransferase [Armatimonadota bacterium]
MHNKLAIEGGTPAKTTPEPPMLPGAWEIGEAEKKAVLEVLDEKILFRYYGLPNRKSRVQEFEERFAAHIGTKYALAVNSGTSSLIAGLVGAGIGPGDEVIVPAYTFVASPAAIIAAKAIPVIAEVDNSLTLDPNDFERKITKYTKAVMPVHMRGTPCDMDRITNIAKKHGIKIIEDVAQSCGASYKGKPLGTFGDVGCFSLQMYKVITSGEGGVVVTDNSDIYDKARMYHDAAVRFWGEDTGMAIFPGVNFRMSELAGALALVQLSKLEDLLARMRENKRRIKSQIEPKKGLEFRKIYDEEGEAGLSLVMFMPNPEIAKQVAAALQKEGIGAGTIYNQGIPDRHIYTSWVEILSKTPDVQKGCPFTCAFYKGNVEYSPDMCPQTLDYLGRAIHLNVSPLLSPEDCDAIAFGINKVMTAML